jgi:hypothetical protein
MIVDISEEPWRQRRTGDLPPQRVAVVRRRF